MKFKEDGYGLSLKFRDSDGDKLVAGVYPQDEAGFLLIAVNSNAVSMTRAEAKAFVKAIKKAAKR